MWPLWLICTRNLDTKNSYGMFLKHFDDLTPGESMRVLMISTHTSCIFFANLLVKASQSPPHLVHFLCQSVRQMNLIIFAWCIFCNNLSDQEIQSSPPGTSSSQLRQIKKFNHLYQVHHPLHRSHQIKQFDHLHMVHLLHRPVRSGNLIISNSVQLSSQICQTKQKWDCCSVWDQNHHSHNMAIWGRFSVLFFFSSGLKETPHIILLKIFAKTEFTSRGKPPCWCWWSKIFSPWKTMDHNWNLMVTSLIR